ncbi:hypothetical protein M885DRAFT_454136, partial [Pelagophyceae sp. CCMP2097]
MIFWFQCRSAPHSSELWRHVGARRGGARRAAEAVPRAGAARVFPAAACGGCEIWRRRGPLRSAVVGARASLHRRRGHRRARRKHRRTRPPPARRQQPVRKPPKERRAQPAAGLREASSSGATRTSSFGVTLLHKAARAQNFASVQSLVHRGAERTACDVGRVPLHDCVWAEPPDWALVEFLVVADPQHLLCADSRNWTPLDFVPEGMWGKWRRWLD